MRSGPGEARTILLFHTISARPPKQPRMVRTFLKAYMELGSYFLFLALVRLLKIIVLYWKTSPVCHCRMGNTTDDCDKRPHQLTSVVHKRNRGTWPGEARTILLFHTISARPSKQPLRVRTFLKVYMEIGS